MNTMQSSRLSNLRDYLALFVRRKWLIVSVFVGCLGVAMLVASIIPNVYVSESMILFQAGDVSNDFVKEITSGTADERLAAIQATILSRSNLLKIVKEFEPGVNAFRGISDERKVDRMRSRLELEFMSEKARNADAPITHVRIRYREQDPELARRITARLSSLFIEKENRTREDQVYGTTEFLKGELAKVTGRLAESAERLKATKERYKDELPAQLEANLRSLDRLQQQKTANQEALDREINQQLTIERQLAQTSPKITTGAAAAVVQRNPLIDAYLKRQAEYKDLAARATDKHPDVIRLKSELEHLRRSIPPEDFDQIGSVDQGRPKPKTEVNPVYQNLVAQLSQVKTEIEIRQREKRIVDSQIRENTQRVQNTPQAEQEIALVERGYSDLSKQADDLRTKLDQARLSETLESRQQLSQFVVIDPANYPADPAFPNRTFIRLAGFGLSLGIALFAGVVADLSRRRVFTSFELERFLNAPVLVEIPRVIPAGRSRHTPRLRLKYAAIILIGACVYALGLYNLYLHQGYVLRVLDPFIQNAGLSNAQK